MKFDSPLYDRIRVKPTEDRRLKTATTCCEWPGCANPSTHRAPKGRGRENEHWRFCLDHVREYNHSYNFFAGMSDDAVASYQKDALTGHRPTWKLGQNGAKGGRARSRRAAFAEGFGADDPFEMYREFGAKPRGAEERAKPAGRTVHNAARKALNTLGLEEGAEKVEIKARFKELVKRHHPDLNRGDRGSEDKLRDIIAAYNYLKSAGHC
jgi:curved DNA-binding protein CbpA